MNSVVINWQWAPVIWSLILLVIILVVLGIARLYRKHRQPQNAGGLNWNGIFVLLLFYLIGFYWVFFVHPFYEIRLDPTEQTFVMTYYFPRRTVVLNAEQVYAMDIITLHHRFGKPHYQLRCLGQFEHLYVSGDFDESQRAAIERQLQPWRELILQDAGNRNHFGSVVNLIH